MAGHCPACFIRLPLSGEANCDCEPRAVGGPVSAQGSPRPVAHPDYSGPNLNVQTGSER